MKEIFRNFKSYYQISNFGNVKNSRTGKLLKPQKSTKGYLQVRLYEDGVGKLYNVHRLVAMTFPDLVDWTEDAKGKPFNELQVNHKDELDKTNNRVDNLEWCTNDYNTHYGTHYERVSKTLTNSPKISKPVLQYTLDGQFVAEYPSAQEAHRQTGFSQGSISNCCREITSSYKGFRWCYKDNLF